MLTLIMAVVIKQYKPEFAIYISLVGGTIIIFMILDKLTGIINLFSSLNSKTGINSEYIKILLKITGIAILTEFGVSVCKDAGEVAIANKMDLASKVIIVSLSIPIITALLELVISILP